MSSCYSLVSDRVLSLKEEYGGISTAMEFSSKFAQVSSSLILAWIVLSDTMPYKDLDCSNEQKAYDRLRLEATGRVPKAS